MSPLSDDQWNRFFSLIGSTPPGEMAAALDRWELEGVDPAVLAFLRLACRLPTPPTVFLPGQKIGGKYTVIRELGRGGMGIVYQATQDRTQQVVAVKMIHPSVAAGELVALMNSEIAMLGRLEHPGIVRIFDADLHGESPTGRESLFYVMAYVEGRSLTEHATAFHLDQRQRIELFLRLADAVRHAHENGIIHRDLKPGNIVVKADGTPCVLDFGLALTVGPWRLGVQDVTEIPKNQIALDLLSTLAGTPAYMSPELLAGEPIGENREAGDVYALGVILFELLAGRLPYPTPPKAPLQEIYERISSDPVPHLHDSCPGCDPALDAITTRALAKKSADRFASVADLVAALTSLLARWDAADATRRARPRRLKLAVAGLLLVLALSGTVRWSWLRNERLKFDRDLTTIIKLAAEGTPKSRSEAVGLAAHWPDGGPDREAMHRAVISALALPELPEPPAWIAVQSAGAVALDLSVDGDCAVGRDAADQLVVWNKAGPPVAPADAPAGHSPAAARFSPDGALVAVWRADGSVALWPWRTPGGMHVLAGTPGRAGPLAFSPDGRWLAVSITTGEAEATVDVYDTASYQLVAPLRAVHRAVYPHGPESRPASDLQFSPDSTRLAVCSEESMDVLVWDVTRRRLLAWGRHNDVVHAVAWEPSTSKPRLLTACRNGALHLWPDIGDDVWKPLPEFGDDPPRYLRQVPGATGGRTFALAQGFTLWRDAWWSPSGNEVGGLTEAGSAVVWDVQHAGPPVSQMDCGPEVVRIGRRSSRGVMVARTGQGAATAWTRWPVCQEIHLAPVSRPREAVKLRFSPGDGRLLAIRQGDAISLFDGFRISSLAETSVPLGTGLCFEPGSAGLLAGGKNGVLKWQPGTEAGIAGYMRPQVVAPILAANDLAFASHSSVFAGSSGQRIRLVLGQSADRGVELTADFVPDRVSLAANGNWLTAASLSARRLALWKIEDPRRPVAVPITTEISTGMVAADGATFAAVTSLGLEAWGIDGWRHKFTLPLPSITGEFPDFFVCAEETMMGAVAVKDGEVHLFDLEHGRRLAVLRHPHGERVRVLALSPRGDRLAALTADGHLQLWNLNGLRRELQPLGFDWGGRMPPDGEARPPGPLALAPPGS